MFDLTPQELMLLIQVASKAAEFERYMFSGLLQDKRDFEATQWRAAIGHLYLFRMMVCLGQRGNNGDRKTPWSLSLWSTHHCSFLRTHAVVYSK
jgi:hypothetical protein